MLYVDTSFLAPLFKVEQRSPAVRDFFDREMSRKPTISHWTRVEFSSLVSKDVRIGLYPLMEAAAINVAFDDFTRQSCTVIDVTRQDFEVARRHLDDHRTGLRAGDALHLAIASNAGATSVYSLDRVMVAVGRSLGLPMNIGFSTAT